jgi:mannose-1-phosphate guanylyltransferase
MSLYDYKFNLKYGVIDTKNNGKVISWNEKPEFSAKINIGCYVMESEVLQLIPKNRSYGMDSVIRKTLAKKKKVGSVISKKGFIDIGDKETYEKTNEEYGKK